LTAHPQSGSLLPTKSAKILSNVMPHRELPFVAGLMAQFEDMIEEVGINLLDSRPLATMISQ